MKRAWAALVVTLVLVVPARLYETFSLVDPKTGFYTDGGRTAGIVAAATAVGMIAIAALGRGPSEQAGKPFRSVPAGVLAALSGAFVAGQSLVGMAVRTSDGNTVMDDVLAVAGLFAAVSLFAAAYDFASGETVLRRHPLLALPPSVWGCLCLISLFVDYAATVNRLENVYHTFTVVFLLLFLFCQAKLLSGLGSDKDGRPIYAYGFSAVVAVLADAVPNLALYFSGSPLLGSFPVGLHLVNVVLAAYILVYLSALERGTAAAPEPQGAGQTGGGPGNPAENAQGPGASPKPENAEKPAPNSEFSPASFRMCQEFLKGAYRSEEKFMEKRGNPASAAKSLKS